MSLASKRFSVQLVGLRVSKPARLDRGGVHDLQPEPVPAGFVATQHPGLETGIPQRSFAFATACESFVRSAAGTDTWAGA